MASRSNPTVDYLLELLQPLDGVDARRMFGVWGIRVGGITIGLVADETLFLKADERTKPAFEAADGAPFEFEMKDRSVTTSYWSVPAGAMDSSAAMLPWARLGLAAALRKAAAKPSRRQAARNQAGMQAGKPAR